MRVLKTALMTIITASLLVGCVVREEPRRRVYVYDYPAEPLPPPAPVEIVPAAPDPTFIWVGGLYVREGDHWAWHRGYWRHR